MSNVFTPDDGKKRDGIYILKDKSIAQLNAVIIAQHSPVTAYDELGSEQLTPVEFGINKAKFSGLYAYEIVDIQIVQEPDAIVLYCSCGQPKTKLCSHQSSALLQVIANENYLVFFDNTLRNNRLKKFAADYGLADEQDLDAYFVPELQGNRLIISVKNKSLLPVTQISLGLMEQQLMFSSPQDLVPKPAVNEEQKRILVFKQHKFYKHLIVELYVAAMAKDGRIKNPLSALAPLQLVLDTNDPLELKFYTAVSRFQQNIDAKINQTNLETLRSVVKNPLNFECYLHDSEISEKISANALQVITVRSITKGLQITVDEKGDFYEVSGELHMGEERYQLHTLETIFGYFIRIDKTLYLVKDLQMMGAIGLFRSGGEKLLIHQSQFKEFRVRILNKLEESMVVKYPYILKATPAQLKKYHFDKNEMIIYLSDFGQHVMILPVMRYGDAEIPIRKDTLIYAPDGKGEEFLVQRNDLAEKHFNNLITQQHPYFEEQVGDEIQYFYLHKKRFLDEGWFLDAFEAWNKAGITILGFNELSGNKLNPNKVEITIKILSGINWFNAHITAKFGKRQASLKHLHKAIRNKTKFVQLDDGTMGILPEAWLEKFDAYFKAGAIWEDELHIPKTNYETIEQLFEKQMLDEQVKLEIKDFRRKFENFESIEDVEVPETLLTTLRPYQKQGLNWLNFLDDFNFGGCLADDMGLGKTIQILAFILSQRNKTAYNTNLLVVPTSLIFNWQAEVAKFAPSLKIHTIYGAERVKSIADFDNYELVLTSYGTLLSDVNFLKDYTFNYIFLDESQNIKNPSSQRYKAVKLLKARNRIAITGTPIENNTFDLYGQLSFACPGLLGTHQYFKEIYAVPIDQFKVSKRSRELHNKISPFILRRTKQEVASELPEKTEMVLHCPMGEEQRGIYLAYEREFREYISATTQEELPKRSMHVLKGLTKLRQICDSPQLLDGVRVPGNQSSKIDTLVAEIEGKSANHKILVFSQFVGMLDLVKKELSKRHIGFAYLTGATRNREQVVNDFQNNIGTRVFLVSLKAGGTGLNLTAADYVYLLDPWWNPAIENQAIDRVYRIGQTKNVVAVRLICPDTIEEKIIVLQETKKELAGKLISSDGIFNSLTKDDLLGLLSMP
ncbi:DEAD/DEAH box helicase family protein [Mucilaginibacter sp. ZT4R22]|uniref:DEAD/DEAH box helicase family protein n=1 Tax=Mucilaginibacter pankratovii TaxID=2772110 RepID=A0ABR7WLJ6_9SPHI|nr:DEAD/DEAH box helicase [Mucilaginibacter pankratovii]MBD1362347.1 DEAD/DEAH box helicase family protein [Mucilaginibacter pankratovii]